jgi:hypothetical protein
LDRETFDSTLRAFRERRPFRPFTIVLMNGGRVEVDHPLALAFRDGAGGFLARRGVPVFFDHEGVSQVIADPAGHSSA